ncbi:methyltransferase [Citrobacter sp. Cpo071]|uniref:methyltransferase n=1 Tax=Citrobacter sp. Cpo071 TaxID=2985133 RepID=UPI002578CA3A|nr:methyltransferase [Citrobacter sp. Cpo071]MDM2857194.1 methyltransferase [Citrobacter sp. Cpo071]
MLTELITAYRYSAALHAFVKLGIPVWLGRMGPISLDDLSAASQVEAHRLSRLLDVMAERNVVRIENKHYALAEEAGALADANSLETLWVLCELGEEYWNMWPDYPLSLRSAIPVSAFETRHGEPFFSYLLTRPELKGTFDRLMAKITEELATEIVSHIVCDDQTEVVDVGGGKGVLMKKLHQRYNLKSATVLDVYPGNSWSEGGIEFVDRDFFTGIVEGKDIYILKNILHDWDDASALNILQNCHRAMTPESTLFVIEIIKQPDSNKGRTLDLLMDALFLGKERFYTEYQALAQAGGFVIDRTLPTSLSQSVMVWRKEKS